MNADLDTLATALYVHIDDMLKDSPERVLARPAGGSPPRLSDAELITLAVMQSLTGHTSEARWLHQGIGYITPDDGHHGRGETIRQARRDGMQRARQRRVARLVEARQPSRVLLRMVAPPAAA